MTQLVSTSDILKDLKDCRNLVAQCLNEEPDQTENKHWTENIPPIFYAITPGVFLFVLLLILYRAF